MYTTYLWPGQRALTLVGLNMKERNVLFNDRRLYGIRHMVKDHSDSEREKTRCRHMGYSFRLAARILLYASSHRQDNTYQSLLHQSWSTGRNEK